MKKLFFINSILMVLLGLTHCSFTLVFYEELCLDALWFLGTGLSLIFLAILNIAAFAASRLSVILATISNTIAISFYLALAFTLREPQAWVAVILIAIELFSFIHFKMGKNAIKK